MNTYEKITAARRLLELPEQATLAEIKANYRRLIKKWHPDSCSDKGGDHVAMTAKLNAAYRIVIAYCNQYRFSFSEDEIKKYLPTDEWWLERFGNDPLWSNKK